MPENAEQQALEALSDKEIPKIYANGFSLNLSNADIQIALLLSNRHVAFVNMSYTLTKTLQVRLGQLLAEFESKTDRKMLRTDEVDAAFKAGSPSVGEA